jgi:chromosome segregation ATPase
MESDNIDS